MNLKEYTEALQVLYKSGNATEHSYRSKLEQLLESLVQDVKVTNEPKRQACGALDYIITCKEIPVGYIEAKDIAVDLNKVEKCEQMKRYQLSLDNLVLADYMQFRLFREGEKVATYSHKNLLL